MKLTSITISASDDRALFQIGTRIYYSAYVQMDDFWQGIIQKKATSSENPQSQERIFQMKPVNKLLRMFYDRSLDLISCKLETLNNY